MKIIRLFAMAVLSALFLSASAFIPKTEKSSSYVKITNVERTDSSLRLGIRLQNRPNFWVRIPSDARLIAVDDTTRQYKITGTENIALDQEIWMPESGSHEGILIFEKVPEDVKVVDLVERDYRNIDDNSLGIHLDEPATHEAPKLITIADILNGSGKPAEKWAGIDVKRYADLGFYKKDGKTHLKGRIPDYSPRSGIRAISVRTQDEITHSNKVNVGTINPDGSFEMDLPVVYPQFGILELGKRYNNLFLIPGDTLSLVTSMSVRVDPATGYQPEYYGFEGEPTDGVVITMLTDTLIKKRFRFTDPASEYFCKYYLAPSDSMKTETIRYNEKLAGALDDAVAELPEILGNLPISVFAKDMLAAYVVSELCEGMENLELYFKDAKGPGVRKDESGEFSYHEGETLDTKDFIAGRLKHKKIIYDNPLLLCVGWVLPNRWAFNSLFRNAAVASQGLMDVEGGFAYTQADDPSEPYRVTDNFLDSIGLGKCFVTDLLRTSRLINSITTHEIPSYGNLERVNKLVAMLIRHNDSQVLNEILMDAYTSFVKDVMIAENAIAATNDAVMIDGTAEGEVLDKIIAPYRGNYLFLDFWGIGCGPCRAGMINQKPLLEEMAGKPFKALYIANAEEGIEACKKWLRNEGIKGEHIFVSGEDWKYLSGLFNITGIPHGVLIDKDGKIINPDYGSSMDCLMGYPELKKTFPELF